MDTAMNLHTYTYDAEGNVTAIDGGSTASYTYDANNQRVEAVTPAGTQEFGFNAGGQRATVWDGSGNLISAQYGGVAYYLAADGHVRFEHDDWTGTERMRTTDTGTIDASFLSLPFGDGLQTVQGTDTDPYHFAGLDQDAQNIEHAAFRELSSVQGRWLRPDPYDGSYNFFDPQSMNRYAYAENTPMSAIDPSGLELIASGQEPGCTNYGDGTADCYQPPNGDPPGGDPPDGGDPPGGGFGLSTGGSIGLGNGGVSVPSGLGFGTYGAPNNDSTIPTYCKAAILGAVNQQFGTNFGMSNIQSSFMNGGGANLVITANGLPASQFNGLQTGRYASGFLNFITGAGPSLHIAAYSPTNDPNAVFNNSNIGGATSVTFTAHTDSAFANNPFGAILHYFLDVTKRGKATRQPCPTPGG